jgi:hypothetical protein
VPVVTVPVVTVPVPYVVSSTTITSTSTYTWYYNCSLSDDGKYIIVSSFMLSRDSGVTFNSIPNTTPNPGNYHGSTMTPDGKVQVATKNDAAYGNYWFSTDYGVTWTTGPGVERYFACCVNDSGSIIIASSDQKVYMTTDTGATWTNYSKTTLLGGISSSLGWCVSNNGVYHLRCPYSSSSYFYASNDSMVSWIPFGSLADSWSYHTCSMSSDGKFQVVNGGVISYLSSDYGTSWQSTTSYLELFVTRDGTKLFSYDKVSLDFGVTWNTIAAFGGFVAGYSYVASANAKFYIQGKKSPNGVGILNKME